MKSEPKLCEHGNYYHCSSCEIKYLTYVIEELQKENEQLKIDLDKADKSYQELYKYHRS